MISQPFKVMLTSPVSVNIAFLGFTVPYVNLKKMHQLYYGIQHPGGGGTLIFSAYVGSDPASALHPKKISGISSTPKKIFEILATPKNIPNSVP